MKLNTKATKIVGVLAAAGALSLSPAVAGPYGMAPTPAPMDSSVPPPPAPYGDAGVGLFDELGMTLSAGYDTDYIFRGVDLGHDFVWSQLELTVPVGQEFSFTAGAWYTTSFNTPGDFEVDSELDLYASLTYTLGLFEVTAGYTHYSYPRGGAFLSPSGGNGDETNEVYLSVGTSFHEMVDVSLAYYYDFDLETSYIEATAGTSFVVNNEGTISIDPSIGISYVDNDDANVSDWNHAFARVGVPIKLTSTATLEPYVATSIALDAIDNTENDYLWGGISLKVSF